jgi:DNA-binding transcriptional LysR family regulator
LNRTGRGVVLTFHGEKLLVHALEILRAHDEAVADLSGAGLVGTIRFGCPGDYASAFLPRVLREFAQHHPRVFVQVHCAPTPRLRERLRAHALDLALVSVAEGEDPAGVIRHEPLVWVGHAGDALAELDPLPLALSDEATLDHRLALEALARMGRAWRIAYASEDLAGLVSVVRSGLAIAVLTRSAVPPDLQVLPAGAGQPLPLLPGVGVKVAFDLARPPALVAAFAAVLETVVPVGP